MLLNPKKPLLSSSAPSSSSSLSSSKCSSFIRLSSILFVLILCSSEVHSINNIGCLIDENLCEDYEYCVEDNLLGFCVSEEDKNEFTREVTRSESAIDTDIDAPIRIHKYNIDESELRRDEEEEESEDEGAKKARIAEALRSVLEERQKKLSSADDDYSDTGAEEEEEDGQRIFMDPSALEQLLNIEQSVDDEAAPPPSSTDYDGDDYDGESNPLASVMDNYDDISNYYDDQAASPRLEKRALADYGEDDDDYLLNSYDDYQGVENVLPSSSLSSDYDQSLGALVDQIVNDKDSDYYLNDGDDYYIDDDDNFLLLNKRSLSPPEADPTSADDDEKENFIAKPLVIEKEGIDDDGNEFYEKDIIMGSGFPAAGLPLPLPPRPVLAQQRLMDALRSEERNILNANVRLMESQLPRVLGMMNAAAAGAGRDRLFTSSNNIFSNFLPQIQMGRQHIARLPFDDESQIEEIGWAKPTLRIKPAFGMIVSSKSSAENQRQPLVEPASLNRLEENLNNADTEFINNLHHVQDAETRQASDRKMLIDEIGQFFDEYDQTAKLGPSPKSSATAEQQMDKKSLESDMAAADMNVFDVVDASYIFIEVDKNVNKHDVELLLKAVSNITQIPTEYIDDINISKGLVFFKISKPNVNTSKYVNIITNSIDKIQHSTGLKIVSCGLGNRENYVEVAKQKYIDSNSENFLLVTIIICATVACVLLSLLVIFLIRRRAHLRNKLAGDVSISGGGGKGNFNDEERLITDDNKGRSFSFWPFNKLRKSDNLKGELASPSQNYQDLCRSRMQGKATPQGPGSSSLNDSTPSIVPNSANRVQSVGSDGKTESSRSSTSSWSEEPITSVNMDITTGHVILAYIEEHLNDKNRLSKEWQDLGDYEADSNKTEAASLPQNLTKNRYSNILAYDHSRVKIGDNKDSDYINANYITDDDPKNPAYIATQGPLIHTTCDFWKMIWEQGSVVIVSLCRTVEYGSLKCNQYWPANGSEVYEKFEVHLVSEHVWCEDYLVRSFYLKNLETNQSRTVTQFHFLTWPENGLPPNIKSLLDFRRKVNKSYKSKASPIIVHCNDGVGRTGTYIMVDMVLNKIIKGAKEIDLAATVEFLRDQRPGMIKTKGQFEYSFAVITEEVQNMLKAIGQ